MGTRPLRDQEHNQYRQPGLGADPGGAIVHLSGPSPLAPKSQQKKSLQGQKRSSTSAWRYTYRSFLKKTSLNTRIMVANVFLLPLFYYCICASSTLHTGPQWYSRYRELCTRPLWRSGGRPSATHASSHRGGRRGRTPPSGTSGQPTFPCWLPDMTWRRARSAQFLPWG